MKRLNFVVLVLLASLVGAQDLAPRPFSFKWKPVEAAGGYIAEVRDGYGDIVATQQVEATKLSIVFPLVPGNYTLRLTTLNRFLTAESDTGWVPIHVSAAAAPQVADFPAVTLKPDQGGSVELPVKGLAQDATASLRSPTGRLIALALSPPVEGRLTLALPPLAERGTYDLVLTNPPVLSTTWHEKIVVKYPLPLVDEPVDLSGIVGETPESRVIAGRDFSPLVQLWLEGQGTKVLLPVSGASENAIPVVWPELKVGTYRLLVTNAPGDPAVVAGTVTWSEPPPPPPNVEVVVGQGADLGRPVGLAISQGDIFGTDAGNNLVYRVTSSGETSTFAGAKRPGNQDGTGDRASFNRPSGLAVDGDGLLYVVDVGNGVIRQITVTGVVSTLVRLPAQLQQHDLGIAVDPLGVVALSDPIGHRIWRIEPKGQPVVWVGTGKPGTNDGPATEAQFSGPQGLVFDTSGNLYVADSGNERIRKVSPDGVVSTVQAGLSGPTGLAFDQQGNLLVTEPANHQVVRVVDGVVLPLVNESGRAMLSEPSSVAVGYDGHPLVADPTTKALVKVDSLPAEKPTPVVSVVAGSTLAFFRNGPSLAAGFRQPVGVVVNPDYEVLVADTGNNRIRKVDRFGAVTTVAGTGLPGKSNGGFGEGPATFDRPTVLALDAANALYVVDQGNHLVRRVSPQGEVSTPWPRLVLPDQVKGVAIDLFANLYYVAGKNPGSLVKIDARGVASTVAGDLVDPSAVTVDNGGNVYVSDPGTHSVVKFDRRGARSTVVQSDSELPSPRGLVWTTEGSLWVADVQRSQLLQVTDGTLVPGPNLAAVGPGPLATNQNGDLLWTAGNQVLTYNPSDLVVSNLAPRGTVASASSPPVLSFPTAIAADPRGGHFVVDANQVVHVDEQGRKDVLAGAGEAGDRDGDRPSARFRGPLGLVAVADAILVADTGNNVVRKVLLNGTVTTLIRGLNRPEGLAVTPDGRLFVAENGARRISEYTLDGNRLSTVGTGASEAADGVRDRAGFLGPHGLSLDDQGFLLVADDSGIRLVNPEGTVGTLAASYRWASREAIRGYARLWGPTAVAAGPGGWAAVDAWGNTLLRGDNTGQVHYYAGNQLVGNSNGESGRFNHPVGVAWGPDGSLWVTDSLGPGLRLVVNSGDPVPEGWTTENSTNLTLAGVSPTKRTIPQNADLSAWAGILPSFTKTPWPLRSSLVGTAPNAVYLASDDQYLYWLVTIADGSPRYRDIVNFSLTLRPAGYNPPENKQVQLQVGSWEPRPRAQLNWGPGNNWQAVWQGGSFDCVWGEGAIQGRFPLTWFKDHVKDWGDLQAEFGYWNDDTPGSPHTYSGFPRRPFAF